MRQHRIFVRGGQSLGWEHAVALVGVVFALLGCKGGAAPTDPAGSDASQGAVDTSGAAPDVASLDVALADSLDAASVDGAGVAAASREVGLHHASLLVTLAAHVDQPALFSDGYWQEHYGDAFLYGPTYDLAHWSRTGDGASLERATATLTRGRELVVQAASDLGFLLQSTETVAMALLGLLEAASWLDEPLFLAEARALLAMVDAVSSGMGDYLDFEVGGFASTTYGPTSLTAFVALMHVEMALAVPQEAESHLGRFGEVVEALDAHAWDAQLGGYRFAPDDDRLFLYPNALVMLALGRAATLDARPEYLERIAALRVAIEPLRMPGGYFRSPYSAAVMGAKTNDYATLSATNYLMLALLFGARATGVEGMLGDIDSLLGFCETHLLQDGRLLHHWMDGRIAQPTDPSYYCTGCNLQTLVVLELLMAR